MDSIHLTPGQVSRRTNDTSLWHTSVFLAGAQFSWHKGAEASAPLSPAPQCPQGNPALALDGASVFEGEGPPPTAASFMPVCVRTKTFGTWTLCPVLSEAKSSELGSQVPPLSVLCVKNRAFGITECSCPRERHSSLNLKVCFHLTGCLGPQSMKTSLWIRKYLSFAGPSLHTKGTAAA